MPSAFSIKKSGFRSDLNRFARGQNGSAAVFVAFSMVVLVAAAGIALDAGRGYYLKARLSQAVDAAALAGGSSYVAGSSDYEAQIQKYFAANFTDGLMGGSNSAPTISVNAAGDQITVSATAEVPTTLMQVLNLDGMTVSASATVNRSVKGTELVMVLDTTGSMGFGSSWSNAKTAMAEMLQGLDDLSGDDEFYATFVPMSDRINVGTNKASWLSVGAPAGWNGCMEPREVSDAGFPYAQNDQPPSEAGFLPTAEGYYISALADQSFFTCPAQQILGPTDDVATIESAIESLSLSGTGRMDEGMAWAWRLLSPEWNGLWSVPDYPADHGDRRKVVVYITDMYTEAYRYEVGGEAEGNVFGWNKGSQWGFEHFVHVCDQMKDDGIEIHAVYVNGNSHGVSYMQECATSDAYYHEVTDVAALRDTLEAISGSVTQVWLGQ